MGLLFVLSYGLHRQNGEQRPTTPTEVQQREKALSSFSFYSKLRIEVLRVADLPDLRLKFPPQS